MEHAKFKYVINNFIINYWVIADNVVCTKLLRKTFILFFIIYRVLRNIFLKIKHEIF